MRAIYCGICKGYLLGDLPDFTNVKVCTCGLPPPQKQPFRCPVCGGNGLVPDGFYNITTGQWTAPTYVLSVNCRSCNGTGIVWG